ncbi:MAG: M20 family metallopeptidase [Firmicutes bacterium]|nr:M20 family metallopeptidase [Bacillota bacterium]
MGIDLKKYLDELEVLVNIDSGSYDVEGLNKMADALEEMYKNDGLFVTRRRLEPEGHPHLVAATHDMNELSGIEKPWDIMFIGHIDTVFPAGTASERPFTVDGNNVKGPGAADMKAGDLMALHLIRELRNEFPDKCFAIVNNGDEELGSPYSGELLLELAKNAKYALDMEPGRITGNFVHERKGSLEYWVDIHGLASHAGSYPDKGASSIREAGRWIETCAKLHKSLPGLTVNVGVINGGTASNVVPEHTHMKIDVRIMDYSQAEVVEKAFNELVANPFDERIKTEYIKYSDMPPMKFTDEAKMMVEILKEEAAKMNYEFDFESSGGASDASFVSGGGTPIIDACGPHGDNLHNDKEYFLLDTVEKRYTLIANLIRRLLSK